MADTEARKKRELLGKSWGAAYPQMLKNIIFEKVVAANGIKCMRCDKEMTREDFSIDHIENWRGADDPLSSLIDADNCGFSHLSCNHKEMTDRRKLPCGTTARYYSGCRCVECKKAMSVWGKEKREYNAAVRKEKCERLGT